MYHECYVIVFLVILGFLAITSAIENVRESDFIVMMMLVVMFRYSPTKVLPCSSDALVSIYVRV